MINKPQRNYSLFCEISCIYKKYWSCCIENLIEHQELAKRFLNIPFSLILQGDAGRGKTYFLLTLVKELLDVKGFPRRILRFIKAMDLQDRVEAEIKEKGNADYFLQGLKEVKYLFIDDFGVERTVEKAERNYYELLDARIGNCLPTVISTNLTDDEVLNNYGTRIYSRLHEFSRFTYEGPDLRQYPIKELVST